MKVTGDQLRADVNDVCVWKGSWGHTWSDWRTTFPHADPLFYITFVLVGHSVWNCSVLEKQMWHTDHLSVPKEPWLSPVQFNCIYTAPNQRTVASVCFIQKAGWEWRSCHMLLSRWDPDWQWELCIWPSSPHPLKSPTSPLLPASFFGLSLTLCNLRLGTTFPLAPSPGSSGA